MPTLKSFILTRIPDSIVVHLSAYDHLLNGEPEIRLLSRLCNRDKVSVDVGANVGSYTYFLQKFSREVHAFEPNPTLATRLKSLFPRVIVHQSACSDDDGSAVLHVPVEAGLWRELHERGTISDAGDASDLTYPVSVVQLDSFGFENVGFLKVDAERHERNVLHGAIETIRRSRPVIMTEFTPLLYDPSKEFKFLLDLGYEGWFRFRGERRPLSTEWVQEFHGARPTWKEVGVNMLFLQKSESMKALAI